MTTYKGIGYDNVSAKTRTATSSDTVEFVSGVTVDENLAVTKNAAISGNATVAGNLTVQGDIVSRGQVDLVVQDPMIDLGIGATGSQVTGFSFLVAPGSIANAAIASIDAASKQVTMSAAISLTAGQIVAIAATSDGSNIGLYVVKTTVTSSTTFNINDAPAGIAKAPFLQTAFDGNSTGGNLSLVDLKVLAVSDGSTLVDASVTAYPIGLFLEAFYEDATLTDFTAPGAYQPVGASGATLQTAYEGGRTISATAGEGAIAFDLNNTNFTVDSETHDGAALFGSTHYLSNFAVTSTTVSTSTTAATTIASSQNDTDAIQLNATNALGGVSININSTKTVSVSASFVDITGALNVSGSTDLGSDSSDTLSINAVVDTDIIPSGEKDLGSSGAAWTLGYIDTVYSDEVFVSSLTDTYIVFADANGQLVDSSDLTFNGTSLAVGTTNFTVAVATGNTVVGGTLDVAGLASLDGGIDVDGAFTVADGSGDVVTSGTLEAGATTLNSTLSVAGEASLNGDVNLGDAATDSITFTGRADSSLLPIADSTYNLGSAALAWANVFTDSLTITGLQQNQVLFGGASGTIAQDGLFVYDTGVLKVGFNGATPRFTVDSANGNVSTTGTLSVSGLGTFTDDISMNKAGSQLINKIASAPTQDLSIKLTNSGPATDSSIVLNGGGNGADAIRISTKEAGNSNGGSITMVSDADLTVTVDDSISLTSSANAAGDEAINLTASNAGAGKGEIIATAKTSITLSTTDAANGTVSSSSQVMQLVGNGRGRIATFSAIADTNGLSPGATVYLYHNGTSIVGGKANADTIAKARFVGVAKDNAASGNSTAIYTSGVVAMVATANVAVTDAGKEVYISKTNGQVTMDVSGFVNGDTVYRVGYIVLANGTTNIDVLLAPQFIMQIG
jgi:hypothetical protein